MKKEKLIKLKKSSDIKVKNQKYKIKIYENLLDQVALVTVSSSGLGYRFSKILAKCGAKVALAARRVEKLEALEKEIRDEGGECAVIPLDVQDRDSIRNAVDVVENQLGLINTLVNNAGKIGRASCRERV